MKHTKHPFRVGAMALLLSLSLLTGCGGSSSKSSTSSGGVASVDASKAKSGSGGTSSSSSKDSEKELLKYTKCLRKQGLDVPDPTVDANGNLQLGGGPGASGGSGAPAQTDRSAFQKAQKVCGKVPSSVTAGFNNVDQSALQDTALKYAKCMRKNGVDMADPDFSNAAGPGSGGGSGGSGGPFGNVNRNDPTFKKANESCQKLFAGIRPGQTSTTVAN